LLEEKTETNSSSWIILSSATIVYNKYILDDAGFRKSLRIASSWTKD
jgi:hypothetical protein